ncbi:hypothetical protein BGZ65_005642, partial [Modicella reniformis]
MPKSSSKRKKEKNADFKKTKLKVGKKKAVADNFTDTSFKSKAISLPSQSISHDKTALLTNARNVTFAELMTQLKHYSPNTRKDALLGLRDLFHRHPHLLPLHLGTLLNSVVRLLIDDSSIVRKALQSFLGEFIPVLHPRDVHPFLPLLVVYTCSAMTHILEDIREDALKFMDLWVAAGGQLVVNGFWDKILPNYVSLLTSDSNATNASKLSGAMSFSAPAASSAMAGRAGAGSGSSTSKTVAGASTSKNAPGSLKAKSEVLQSLAGFLQEGLGEEGGEKDPYWFLRNSLGTAHARKSFNTTRVHLGGHDAPSGKRKRKVSELRNADMTLGRSTRRKADANDTSNDEDDQEDSDDSDTNEKSSQSDRAIDLEDTTQDESLVLDASPVVSFSHAGRHNQHLNTFPIHPSAVRSTVAQTIFGHTQNLGPDVNDAASFHIKIFPQQGGAVASGAGPNGGTNGPRNSERENNLGGVQGRLLQIKLLISTLHPLLLSAWLDTAPNVFASTTTIQSSHALNIVHLVLRIWGILWRAALARPKKKAVDSEEDKESEKEEEKWLEEYLQSLLRHVLIYFPFGKDIVGMLDSKVSAMLQEMNTIYCELTSLFMLGSGIGRIRRVHKDSLKKPSVSQESSEPKAKRALKTSYQPSNRDVKKNKVQEEEPSSSSSSDYDSEEEEGNRSQDKIVHNDNMVTFQVEPPAWAEQVVDYVLITLGWVNPEASESGENVDGSQMTGLSSDFKSNHLVALLPTLWTLLNCLEPRRKEWVFEALITFFDATHVQSASKKVILQFLALMIKLQSHPHYTGSFSVMVPGRGKETQMSLKGLSKKDRKQQYASILKMSNLLRHSLLKLPKLLWDLVTERLETSETILDLLVEVTMIAGESHAGAAYEKEQQRVQFLKTLQSHMALFFCVTVAGKGGEGGKRKVMGPFVKLPPDLQRRAIEIVYYSGVVFSRENWLGGTASQKKKDEEAQKQSPLLAAVKSCCQ